MDDGSYIFDPDFAQEKESKLHIVVAGTSDAITMVEAGGKEVSNQEMLDILAKAHEIIKDLCSAQEDFLNAYEAQFGEITPITPTFNNPDETLYHKVELFLTDDKLAVLYNKGKKEFQRELDILDDVTKEHLVAEGDFQEGDDMSAVGAMVYKRVKKLMRKNVLENHRRLDGRAPNEVRKIKGETGLLPRTHGSALFQRGMTQVLNICTLG